MCKLSGMLRMVTDYTHRLLLRSPRPFVLLFSKMSWSLTPSVPCPPTEVMFVVGPVGGFRGDRYAASNSCKLFHSQYDAKNNSKREMYVSPYPEIRPSMSWLSCSYSENG